MTHTKHNYTIGIDLGNKAHETCTIPGRDQSGDTDKPMRITKAGNRMLRRLLVSCAQYTLGKFGPDSALKESGQQKIITGSKVAKKKAVVKTARKLAVLMLAL